MFAAIWVTLHLRDRLPDGRRFEVAGVTLDASVRARLLQPASHDKRLAAAIERDLPLFVETQPRQTRTVVVDWRQEPLGEEPAGQVPSRDPGERRAGVASALT
jgi:hypothetical protein